MKSKEKILVIANSTTFHQAPRGTQANRILSYLAIFFDIFLITSDKSIPDKQNYFNNRIKNIYILKQGSSSYFRIQQELIGFLGSFDFFFMIKSYLKSKEIIKNKNINQVITHSVKISNAFTGALLKLRFGRNIKVISFYSDPFSFNDYIKKTKYKHKIVLKLERFLFKNQDIIVFPSKIMVDRYIELYPEYTQKFRHIPHSYLASIDNSTNIYLTRNKSDEKLVIRYIGSLNEIRNPKFILDYIEKHKDFFEDRIYVEFIGPKSEVVIDDFGERKLVHDVVKFIPKVSVHDAEELAKTSDILLLLDANIVRSPYLPSKLVDYLSYNKPIIGFSNPNGESSRVLKDSNHFPLDFNEINKFIDTIENIALNKNKLNFNIEDYSINRVGESWQNILS